MQIGNSVLSLSMVESTKRSELTWYKGTCMGTGVHIPADGASTRRLGRFCHNYQDNRSLASFVLTKLRAVRPHVPVLCGHNAVGKRKFAV